VLDPHCKAPFVNGSLVNIRYEEGNRVRVSYRLNGGHIRYFRLPDPMDRIYSVRLLKDGSALELHSPRISNLQASYEAKKPVGEMDTAIRLPENIHDGDYIAVALNGVHGNEGAYCVAEMDGKGMGFPDRAPAYAANVWEFIVTHADRNYTYYLPLEASMSGREMKVHVLLCDKEHMDFECDVWLCPAH